ncbi:MAG TPA: fibronectin type III domain-containing protein [Longimicrobium sp.]|nr:fibronectin type III domain-containing protein [Longimicrobium sp.]
MPLSSPLRALLPLAVLFAAASCDRPLVAPAAAPAEVEFTTGATLPAVPGFTAQANIHGTSGPLVMLSWQDVAGEDIYLIQWRVGDAGNWQTLVTTGANRTSFGTNSVTLGARNSYRIAAMTSSFQAGPFTTLLMPPSVTTDYVTMLADSVVRIGIGFRNFGPAGATYFVQYGTDPGLAGAVQTPGVTPPQYWAPHEFRIPVQPGTRYYFRVVGTGDNGTGYDSIRSFVAGVTEAPVVSATFHEQRVGDDWNPLFPAYRTQIDWAQPGVAAHAYRIHRRLVGVPGWLQVGERPGAERGFQDSSVPISFSGQYEYRVLACDAAGRCAPSIPAPVTIVGMPPPTNLTAAQTAEGRVVLTWSDLPHEEQFIIQWRADSAASWTNLVTTGRSRTYYAANWVTPGKINDFRIAGMVGWRLGAWANVSVAVSEAYWPPPQDSASPVLTAAFSVAGNQVNLSWTPSGIANPTRSRIYRHHISWNHWTLLKELPAGVRSFADLQIPLFDPQTYYYVVEECDAANQCSASAVKDVRTAPVSPPPPSGLTATRLPDGRVRLQWQDRPGDQQYIVKWRVTGDYPKVLVTTGTNVTSYTTTQVVPGKTNYYSVAVLVPGYRTGYQNETSLVVP